MSHSLSAATSFKASPLGEKYLGSFERRKVMAGSVTVVGADNRTKLAVRIDKSDRLGHGHFYVNLPPTRLDLTYLEAQIHELCPREATRLISDLHRQILDQILK